MFRLVLFFVFSLMHNVEPVKVQVEQGWLEGEQLDLVTEAGQYYSFKGIPYAKPPVGQLRFKAPQAPLPWESMRNATRHGPVCIQYDVFAKKIVYGSEDCLFLNVYSPNLNPKSPLPVMVFIHGGGYESDSGNVDNYGPDFLVQNGVIVVTFNYRLEVLGFLSLDTKEVPGNAGMKDQVAALKWIKKNIRNFGGDPENITLFGQSAGGAATIFHILSPMSKGLFTRAIAISGVPSCDWSISYKPRRRAFVLGKQLGEDTNDATELLEYLQSLPADKLVGVEPNVLTAEEIPAKIFKLFHFTPVIEKDFGQETFITEEPEKLLKEGKVNVHDLIIGHTSEEAMSDLIYSDDFLLSKYATYAELLVPRKIIYERSSNKILELSDMIMKHYFGTQNINKDTIRELLTYLNDSIYGYDTYRYIQMFYKLLNTKIYVYRFSGISERNIYGNAGDKYNLTGASHLDDMAYLFDPKHAKLSLVKDSKGYKIIKNISTLFTNFAKYGNPTPNNDLGISWPAYDNTTERYMNIADQLKVATALDKYAAVFWRSLYNQADMHFDYILKLYGK